VNPLSQGVIATPKKGAILEALRITEGLTNGCKPLSLLGHTRLSIAQKGLVSSDPLEGGIAQTLRGIIACRCVQTTYERGAVGRRGGRAVIPIAFQCCGVR
jgi:hypothetical protein